MKATLLLADYARVVEGRLDVLGAGWNVTGPGPVSMGLGVTIEIPWDEAFDQHQLLLQLVGPDGQPVMAGDTPIALRTQFTVGRSPVVADGAPQPWAVAFNVSNLVLPPGQRFQWRMEIDGMTDEAWQASFQIRSAPPG